MALIGGSDFNDNNTFNGIPWIFRPSLRGTGWHDQIFAKKGHDILLGLAGNDELYGQEDNDTLFGGGGNDTHYGGTGDYFMYGSLGNDSYYVDSAGDTVREDPGQGIDTVYSSINYTLPNNVENLNLTGNARFGFGNSLDNDMKVFSNSRINQLAGRSGDDTITGNAGVDHLFGENDNDLLKGLHGDDHLFGGFNNDTVYGDHGNDKLYGQQHDDLLYGGKDSDTLYGGSGNDTLWGTGAIFHNDIDELWGGTNADTFALGAKRAVHYWRGNGHALIKDFNRFEDTIQLAGNLNRNDYSLWWRNWDGGGFDTGIYYKNDLIGVVSGQLLFNLNGPEFDYSV